MAFLAQRLDHAQLLLGAGAREHDLRRIERELQLRVGEVRQLLARHQPRRLALDESDGARHGVRRARVVAGDHDDADAGLPAAAHRRRHFGARRILQPDQASEHELILPALPRQPVRHEPPSQREHAFAARRDPALGGDKPFAQRPI